MPGSVTSYQHVAFVLREVEKHNGNIFPKHVIVVFCASTPKAKLVSFDFNSSWNYVFLASVNNTSPRFPVSHLPARVASRSLLEVSSWVDLVDKQTLDVFGAINSLFGSLACVTMIQYRTAEEQNAARNAIFYLLDQKITKDMLSKKVFHTADVSPAKSAFRYWNCLKISSLTKTGFTKCWKIHHLHTPFRTVCGTFCIGLI